MDGVLEKHCAGTAWAIRRGSNRTDAWEMDSVKEGTAEALRETAFDNDDKAASLSGYSVGPPANVGTRDHCALAQEGQSSSNKEKSKVEEENMPARQQVILLNDKTQKKNCNAHEEQKKNDAEAI